MNEAGEITKIETEKNGADGNPYKTLDIHRIRGGFSKRKELKPGSPDFQTAVRLLDESLETFKLPYWNDQEDPGLKREKLEITSTVRGKIRKNYDT